jgi:hypothetical protein
MATITLTANTNVSALSLANDDTIDLAGFQLNFDVQPTATGIQVITPGAAGTCVFPVACAIPTWDFFTGTAANMIATLPANCEIKSISAGSVTNARGVSINNGIIGTANAGSGSTAIAVSTNNGTIGVANAGSGSTAIAVLVNSIAGFVGVANGGSAGVARGVSENSGRVGVANGGSNATAYGVWTNTGSIETANGGSVSGASGVLEQNGICLRAFDATAPAVGNTRGDLKFVIGPDFQSAINNPAGTVKTIYSLGALAATIPAGATVITLSEGTGCTAGFTGIEGISRSLGT